MNQQVVVWVLVALAAAYLAWRFMPARLRRRLWALAGRTPPAQSGCDSCSACGDCADSPPRRH